MLFSLEALQIFVKVAELSNFTRAAEQLGMPKARASWHVKRLEEGIGTALLQRSTRRVELTPEGERFLARARCLMRDAEDLGAMFHSERVVRGRVRIDLPVNIGREIVLPRLPELVARHPSLELTISTTDRRSEPFREGFDCLLRVGDAADGSLVGRRLGTFRMMNCVSPSYLRTHGVPTKIEDLHRHLLVHYASTLSSEQPTFEYVVDGVAHGLPMPSAVTVNNVDAYQTVCLAGLGIIQVPRIGVQRQLAAGTLVEVLADFTCAPMPVTLLHTHGRSVPRRVRAVMNWLAEVLIPYLEMQPD